MRKNKKISINKEIYVYPDAGAHFTRYDITGCAATVVSLWVVDDNLGCGIIDFFDVSYGTRCQIFFA